MQPSCSWCTTGFRTCNSVTRITSLLVIHLHSWVNWRKVGLMKLAKFRNGNSWIRIPVVGNLARRSIVKLHRPIHKLHLLLKLWYISFHLQYQCCSFNKCRKKEHVFNKTRVLVHEYGNRGESVRIEKDLPADEGIVGIDDGMRISGNWWNLSTERRTCRN